MNPPTGLKLRPATEADAEALIAYMHRVTNEPHNNITLDPGQWKMTVEEERAFVARRNSEAANGIFAVAEMAGEIVSVAGLTRGANPTNRNVSSLGISVDAAWRNRGIGLAMMIYLLEWAKSHGIVRMELKVFTRNVVAIRLYEKLGFVAEGRHPYASCKQGIWVEDLTMGLILHENLPSEPRK